MTSIVPRELGLLSARAFIESVDSANGPYYVWIGNPVDPSSSKDLYDTYYYTQVEPYKKMILGKAVTNNDVALMLREIPYEANTVYAMYDDSDPQIFDKDFYVSVTSGDYVHVFKCLFNNNGNPSTAAPDIGDVDENDVVYQTSDGYQWRYMFTAEDVDILKFSSPGYIPLFTNALAAAAVSGAIDVVNVLSPGAGYSNHLTGTFALGDVAVDGNSRIFSLASNTVASSTNGHYTGCLLYIATGTGAGGYRTISDYVSNSSGKYAVVDSEFSVQPLNGSTFQISPGVIIRGSGFESVNAAARAVINSTGNTVYRIEVLDRGRGYAGATANIVANSAVGVTSDAVLRVINGPPGGHGNDVAAELGVTRASVSVKLDGDESGVIPSTGRFGQYGIMLRPTFSFCNTSFSVAGGVASVSANIVVIDSERILGSSSVTTGSNTITGNVSSWTDTFSNGDLVYVTDVADRHMGTVSSVNSTVITLTSSFGWTSSNVVVWKPTVSAHAVIQEIHDANTVCLANLQGTFAVGDSAIVPNGGFWGDIGETKRGGVDKNQSTFIQMTKVVGSYLSGTFEENEVVFQGNSLASATMTGWAHSVVDDGGVITVYVTNQFGTIDVSSSLKGNTSGASLSVTDKYTAELVPGSGRIVYVENAAAAGRDDSQSEELNFLLSFH